MATIDISIADEWIESLGPQWVEAAKRGVYSAALRGVQLIVGKIIPSRVPEPSDRGLFKSGWRAEPMPDGALLFNIEAHADFIEHGVRAANVKVGTAMLRAIAAWAERKGFAAEGGGMKAAWAIVGAMKKRGIFNRAGVPGLGILRECIEVAENLPAFIREEVGREIKMAQGSRR